MESQCCCNKTGFVLAQALTVCTKKLPPMCRVPIWQVARRALEAEGIRQMMEEQEWERGHGREGVVSAQSGCGFMCSRGQHLAPDASETAHASCNAELRTASNSCQAECQLQLLTRPCWLTWSLPWQARAALHSPFPVLPSKGILVSVAELTLGSATQDVRASKLLSGRPALQHLEFSMQARHVQADEVNVIVRAYPMHSSLLFAAGIRSLSALFVLTLACNEGAETRLCWQLTVLCSLESKCVSMPCLAGQDLQQPGDQVPQACGRPGGRGGVAC